MVLREVLSKNYKVCYSYTKINLLTYLVVGAGFGMNLRKNIAEAIRQAELEDSKEHLPILRLINTAIIDRDNRAREEGIIEGVSDRIVFEVLVKLLEQKTKNCKAYEEHGDNDLANKERVEIRLLEDLLPTKLTIRETIEAVDWTIKQLKATGVRDKGRVMATLKENYNWGQMDFKLAHTRVVEKLC